MVVLGSTGTQNAIANGDTRTIRMFHLHTKEALTVTFKRQGRYDEAALKQINWFLRDWRKNEAIRMEPRLLDLMWEAYREVGGTEAINIVCGYRSSGTNEMLRSRTRGVAKASQHTLGRAMDFFIPGVPISSIREVGIRLQRGGVGYYPTSGSPFVHLDVGNVRAWPRMTREQLVRLFPDGKTVHLPSNGGPLSGYAMAMADLQKKGSGIGRPWNAKLASASDDEGSTPAAGPRKRNFLERLLGADEDEDEAAPAATAAKVPAPVKAAPAPAAVPVPEVVAALARPAPAPVADVPIPPRKPAEAAAPSASPSPVMAEIPLPAPPLPAPPLPEAPTSSVPGMVWVQGPMGSLAPDTRAVPAPNPGLPAQAPAAVPTAAPASLAALPPLPRPRPLVQPVQIAATARTPAPVVGNTKAGVTVASRIAAAYSQTPVQTATPQASRPAPTSAVMALASQIAFAGAKPAGGRIGEPAATGSTGQAKTAGAPKLPEDFAERARRIVNDRVALAYASPNVLFSGNRDTGRPMALSLSLERAAPRPPVRGEKLVTPRLDRRGWQLACRPDRARSIALAEASVPKPEQEPALLLAPARALPFGFGSDPSYGTRPDRFAGSPVMLIRTVSFEPGAGHGTGLD